MVPERTELARRIQKANNRVVMADALKIVDLVQELAPYWEKKCGTTGEIPREIYFGLIHVESRFNPKATSGAPAFGLMQLTRIWRGRLEFYKTDEDMYDPAKNIHSGIRVFQRYVQLAKQQNVEDNIRTALAYYNAGPTGARQGRGWDYADKVIAAAKLYEA